MRLIGIHGAAGSGKDTTANVVLRLVAERGLRGEILAFADPLKRIAQDLWGFSDAALWGPSEKRNEPDPRWPRDHVWDRPAWIYGRTCARCRTAVESQACNPLSPREALQLLGTEVARQIHPDTWTRHLLRRIAACSADVVAVPDVRFPNEADALRAAGGRVWFVVRPVGGLAGAAAVHASETSLRGYRFDATIDNGGTLEDLAERVKEAVR
jgi:hypothetical protein